MDDTYRSQFRLPIDLYRRLKESADLARRSLNSELVSRLEDSLADDSALTGAEFYAKGKRKAIALQEFLVLDIAELRDELRSLERRDQYDSSLSRHIRRLERLLESLRDYAADLAKEEDQLRLREQRLKRWTKGVGDLSRNEPDPEVNEIKGRLDEIQNEQQELINRLTQLATR